MCQRGDQPSDPCCVVVVTGVGSMGFDQRCSASLSWAKRFGVCGIARLSDALSLSLANHTDKMLTYPWLATVPKSFVTLKSTYYHTTVKLVIFVIPYGMPNNLSGKKCPIIIT